MTFNAIINIILTVLITSLTGAFLSAIKKVAADYKILQKSQRIMIKDRLVTAHDYFCQKGSIGKYSLETLEELYSEYSDLGGNGFIKCMMNDIRELDIK